MGLPGAVERAEAPDTPATAAVPEPPEDAEREARCEATDAAETERSDDTVRDAAHKDLKRGYAALYALKPDEAIDAFVRVLGQNPRAIGGLAATGVARAHQIRGDYNRAAEWLGIAVTEYPDWCAVYQQGREMEAALIREVWLAAAQTPAVADRALRRYQKRKTSGPFQGWDSTTNKEASLVLGINLLRAGKRPQARSHLEQATASMPGIKEVRVEIAKAYLRLLDAPTP
jgi:tetratricopeptide (TPR) repeat protein